MKLYKLASEWCYYHLCASPHLGSVRISQCSALSVLLCTEERLAEKVATQRTLLGLVFPCRADLSLLARPHCHTPFSRHGRSVSCAPCLTFLQH